jgi:hypothetical protein
VLRFDALPEPRGEILFVCFARVDFGVCSSIMPLSGRPAEWASEAAATPDALLDPASVTVVRHLLSTATSRKPQAALLEALKGRVVQLLADTQGATMVEMLVQYGTVRSVAAVCDALIGSVGEIPMSRGEAKVLAALAKRVDEGRGSRVALFTKFMGSLTPAVVADSLTSVLIRRRSSS